MPRPRKTVRNAQIIKLRDSNPVKYSYAELSRIFNIDRRAIWEIYQREKAEKKKH